LKSFTFKIKDHNFRNCAIIDGAEYYQCNQCGLKFRLHLAATANPMHFRVFKTKHNFILEDVASGLFYEKEHLDIYMYGCAEIKMRKALK
jgi:hypothetical protein